jgi:hypothetical protein
MSVGWPTATRAMPRWRFSAARRRDRAGRLPLDRVIAPYDLRIGQPGSITPAALRRQAEQLHLVDEPRVIVLAGRSYSTAALAVWPAAATPLAGAGGLGRQLARLAVIAQSSQCSEVDRQVSPR